MPCVQASGSCGESRDRGIASHFPAIEVVFEDSVGRAELHALRARAVRTLSNTDG